MKVWNFIDSYEFLRRPDHAFYDYWPAAINIAKCRR